MDTKSKEQEILEWLYHPETVGGLPGNQRANYRRIKRLQKAKKVFLIGYVASNGRPAGVYASQQFKRDNAEHEWLLSQVIRKWGYPTLRGYDVDQSLRPDATIAGVLHVEMDTGSMSLPRVESRFRNYIDVPDPVLVITSTKKRMYSILERCSFLSATLLAVTYENARQAPSNVILEDCDGDRWALNKVVENLRKKARQSENGHLL